MKKNLRDKKSEVTFGISNPKIKPKHLLAYRHLIFRKIDPD